MHLKFIDEIFFFIALRACSIGFNLGECVGKNINLMFKSLANFLVILDFMGCIVI